MLFSTPTFLFAFLPILLALYLPARRYRDAVLLGGSLVFYAWGEGTTTLLLLASIAVNFGLGLWVGAARAAGRSTRPALAVSVTANVGVLVLFKYTEFLWSELDRALAFVGGGLPPLREAVEALGVGPLPADWSIHLPLGISFFTFQALSYLIDVARGQADTQRRVGRFALYIAMFPQLLAGPIVRYRDVAKQLESRVVDLAGFAWGVRRFTVGLAKKVLIADVLATPADTAFSYAPGSLTCTAAWLGLICFSLQIYYDFTGYSDMALGLGRMFGFRFRENFLHPYAARSISEFWRRWHISLSTWFLDYVYFPLVGRRPGRVRPYVALGALFFLTGLWHGASWTMVWPAIVHAVFLGVERAGFGERLKRVPLALQVAYVQAVTLAAWAIFRSPTLEHARALLLRLVGGGANQGTLRYPGLFLDGQAMAVLAFAVLGLAPWVPAVARWRSDSRNVEQRPGFCASLDWMAVLATGLLLVLSVATVSAGTSRPFIYFRF